MTACSPDCFPGSPKIDEFAGHVRERLGVFFERINSQYFIGGCDATSQRVKATPPSPSSDRMRRKVLLNRRRKAASRCNVRSKGWPNFERAPPGDRRIWTAAASAARRRFGKTCRLIRALKSAVAALLCRRSPNSPVARRSHWFPESSRLYYYLRPSSSNCG